MYSLLLYSSHWNDRSHLNAWLRVASVRDPVSAVLRAALLSGDHLLPDAGHHGNLRLKLLLKPLETGPSRQLTVRNHPDVKDQFPPHRPPLRTNKLIN